MIDLHCHLLPGIDDGPADWHTTRRMAEQALADGIKVVVCTPHIYPGLYPNTASGIQKAVAEAQRLLDESGIALELKVGADIHLVPELLRQLRAGRFPTINDSRYVLVEPPHHVRPSHWPQVLMDLLHSGYIPLVTHPERLTWLDHKAVQELQEAVMHGAWLQLTAASLTGHFGRRARYWAELLLDQGLVHVLATDAHDPEVRRPVLSEGREMAAKRLGAEEAMQMVDARPQAVLSNRPDWVVPPPAVNPLSLGSSRERQAHQSGLSGLQHLSRWFERLRS